MQDQYPNTRFEVINTAMTAINSHVALPIARECGRHNPDWFVIYMGNNEVVGPYGSGTIFQPFSPSLTTIRGNILLKSTRIGQLLDKAVHGHEKQREWQGMSMFLENQVAADDPRMGKVYSHFRENLTDICQVAHQSGAKVILCTVATNLKDCAPFASLHRTNLASPDRHRWEQLCDGAIELAAAGRYAEATEKFTEAAGIDDRSALNCTSACARCLLAIGKSGQARKHFILARDLDALRFCADTNINRTIRDVAAQLVGEDVYLVDAEHFIRKNMVQHNQLCQVEHYFTNTSI